jgi:hypothetical protein
MPSWRSMASIKAGLGPLNDEDPVSVGLLSLRGYGLSSTLTRSMDRGKLPAIDHFNKGRHDSSMFQLFSAILK